MATLGSLTLLCACILKGKSVSVYFLYSCALHLRMVFLEVVFNVMLSCDLSGFSLLMVGRAPYPLVVMRSR